MNQRIEYIQEGNTLRTRVVEMPSREEELLILPPEQERPAAAKQRAPFDIRKLGIFMLMTALTVLFALGGILYLQLNSSITASRSRIYSMEQTLTKMRTENDLTAKRMEADVNLSEVYKVATVQLGMVHADGSETISYEEQLREYVRQYEGIPGK